MGLLAVCEKRLDDAELLLNRGVDEMEKWYGPSHPAVARVLQDLARHHSYYDEEERDFIKVEKLYRRVLNIRQTKLGKSHLDVAETLLELGTSVERFLPGKNGFTCFNIIFMLVLFKGCILRKKGTRDSLQECRSLLQRSVDIRTEKLGMYHRRTIEVRKMLVQLA